MKNRLKQLVFIALLFGVSAIFALSFTSCEEGGIDSQPAVGLKLGISAQPAYSVASIGPRDIKFTVTSNTPWTITSDQTWCVPTPVSSTVSALVQEVTVTMEDNESLKPRVAKLTVQGEGVETYTVTITQDSKGELNVAMFETEIYFVRGGETRDFTVQSNKDWNITSDKAWLTFNVSEVTGSDQKVTVQATATENSSNIRKAVVTIKNGLEEKVYEFIQDGNMFEIENLSDTVFNGTVQTRTFTVKANLGWKVEVDSEYDWIHLNSPANGSGDGEVTITVDSRYVFNREARVGVVKVSPLISAPGLEAQKIIVHQNMAFAENGSEDAFTYNPDGSVTFETTGEQVRYAQAGEIQKGTFIWKFSAFDMQTDGTFYIQSDGQDGSSPSLANFIMWFGPKKSQLSNCGGGFGWQAAENFDISGVDFSAVNEIKLEVLDDELNAGKLRFTLYVNGNVIWDKHGKGNPFVNEGENGIHYYWGFNGNGAASFTLDSFSFEAKE